MKAINYLLEQIKYLKPQKRVDIAKSILDLANVSEPNGIMLTSEQVKKLKAAGMEIGGHTVNHPILQAVDINTAKKEIYENKNFLEDLLKEKISSFAYPNGKPGKDYGPQHIALVKEAGYSSAVSTEWGRVTRQCDPFQLPRFTPWDRNPFVFCLRLLIQGSNDRNI